MSPIKAAAKTNVDFYDTKTGSLIRRRKFNENCDPYIDLDVKHPGETKDDHAHDWTNNGRIVRELLSKKEKAELNKAKKKRRFWDEKK